MSEEEKKRREDKQKGNGQTPTPHDPAEETTPKPHTGKTN